MLKVFLIICLFVILNGCTSHDPKAQSKEFIRVEGTQFFKGENPYYFVGTNLWYGCYMGSSGITGDRERLKLELSNLKSLNIDNLRILAASEKSSIEKSLKLTIQPELGVYNENLLEGLDYLLSEMGKRDMHAVIYLNNY